MKILVIGSCTGSKNDLGCPEEKKLIEADFDDPVRLRAGETELGNWRKPAAVMYRGRQHTQMMDGVRLIRSTFGNEVCDVSILSAGYGVISERQPIVPYEVRFKTVGKARIRGQKLGIPDAIRKIVADYPVVFFLLGDAYLASARPPLVPFKNQKFFAFGSSELRLVPGSDVTVIPTADEDAKQFGDNVRTRKGRLFLLLAAGLRQQPEMWDELIRDKTHETAFVLMQAGKQYV